MGVQILQRIYPDQNLFRSALCSLVATPGDLLILSYGYVQDYVLKKQEHQELFTSIKEGFDTINTSCTIVVIGHMQDEDKKFYYFIKYLRDNLPPEKIIIKYFKSKNNNWHSKCAIKVNDKKPIISLTGSSNLTERAFKITTTDSNDYNIETDVLVWDDNLLPKFKGIVDKKINLNSLNTQLNRLIQESSYLQDQINEANKQQLFTSLIPGYKSKIEQNEIKIEYLKHILALPLHTNDTQTNHFSSIDDNFLENNGTYNDAFSFDIPTSINVRVSNIDCKLSLLNLFYTLRYTVLINCQLTQHV